MEAILAVLQGEERGSIFKGFLSRIDWVLVAGLVPLLAAGLLTMNSFVGESAFFEKQLIWISLSVVLFFSLSLIDFRFLRRSGVLVGLYGVSATLLVFLFFAGAVFQGAQSWFNFGWFAFQPSDSAKIVLILVLAKYFSRRHIEIAHIRHILISGLYALVFFLFVFFQPDFGQAIMFFFIWLGMALASGLSKKHLLLVITAGAVSFLALWFFVFEDYQKQRIVTFIHPLTDIRGAGYNAYQSTIAVGSGEIFGKGIGYGTQSKLQFLPEYETDFIFAAFAEEWGFVGVLVLLFCFGVVIWRILHNAFYGATNFETLFGVGLAVLFISHFTIHIGMNIGLLPVTGTTIPFLSYGGSHLVTEFIGLGILMGMRRYARNAHREDMGNEFLGA